jgi:hypothetical protein
VDRDGPGRRCGAQARGRRTRNDESQWREAGGREVSSISVHDSHGHGSHAHEEPQIAARRELDMARLNPGPGFAAMTRNALLFIGLVGIVVVAFSAFSGGGEDKRSVQQHALVSYHMGFLYAMGLALGCLGFQMILQQFNSGWSATVRRTCETGASLFWVIVLLFIPVVFIELKWTHGLVFSWMDPGHQDQIYQEKKGWLQPVFWTVRSAVYLMIWMGLGTTLYRLSRRQDETGDRWLTARARWISSFGLLIFALSTAFASFDWLMSMDFHWFSTMFGVYFFAGCTLSMFAVLIMILSTLRSTGRLGKMFTEEHQHDLGKLLFAFTVFWAYVTFAQYFLIWYSNVPEESAFYNLRNDKGYEIFFKLLCWGHFLVPFVLLLIRPLKRSAFWLRVVAFWMIIMHGVDLMYIARPIVTGVPFPDHIWVDIAGILGPTCLFVGIWIWKMGQGPLVPIKDPRLQEALAHKNYV